MGELWIFCQKLGLGHVVGEKIQYQRDPDPGALDTGPASANSGVYDNALEQRIHIEFLSFSYHETQIISPSRRLVCGDDPGRTLRRAPAPPPRANPPVCRSASP